MRIHILESEILYVRSAERAFFHPHFRSLKKSSSAMLVVKAAITRALWNTTCGPTHGKRRSHARPMASAAAIPHEGPCKETRGTS